MINLIWAMDKNNLVGKDNLLPWHYKKDLIFFKEMTKNKVVLMGEKTYRSMLYYYKDKPFPFKEFYVATRSKTIPNVNVVNDVVEFVTDFNKEELFIIGGKTIYEQTLHLANTLYVTVINAEHEGDTYLDNIDFSNFDLVSSNNDGLLDFRTYERKHN